MNKFLIHVGKGFFKLINFTFGIVVKKELVKGGPICYN